MNEPMNIKNKHEKPTLKDLQDILGACFEESKAQIILDQIEELCLIIIDHYTHGKQI